MNPRAVQYERSDADQVQIMTSRSDEAHPDDTAKVISVSEFLNQQQQYPKQCSAECQTVPIPLPTVRSNDYSPDENGHRFTTPTDSYLPPDNPFDTTQMPPHQSNSNGGMVDEFSSAPNPIIGFSDECRDKVNVLIEAERYLMNYYEGNQPN